MKLYVGVTDYDWFMALKQANCDEVNFWRPSGRNSFNVLDEGDLFLFKLHYPRNYIVGGGFFLKHSILPASLAWDAFDVANGANNLLELTQRVYRYKRTSRLSDPDPQIGCILLSMVFYFDENDWIPTPDNWSQNIVQGKTYSTADEHGTKLYQQVQSRLHKKGVDLFFPDNAVPSKRYGQGQIIKPRIGQHAFKILIADAYHRRCAITGERTLPVLEAAHIKPYSLEGPHEINNGLFLRRDFHVLLDRGYVTVDKDLTVEVSRRIKEDYGNGREYYKFHGSKLSFFPDRKDQLPDPQYLQWHNEKVYLG